jgi:hypothetical protein
VGLASALLLGFITPCLAQETIGAPVVQRALTDTAAASIFALNSGFTQPGTLITWSFYNDNPNQIGMVITPLILEFVDTHYLIRGIGTPQTNDASGVQTFCFGLKSGSDKVDQNFLFGWKDGTDDNAGQTGVIQFDFVASTSAGTQQWFRGGHLFDLVPDQDLGVGILLGAGVNQMDRDYSVQASAGVVETVGAPVVARAVTDTAAGSIFALNSGFTQPGTLITWSFYNDNLNQYGKVLTPLILELVGNEYIIRGIGTPQTNDASGEQSFCFGLVSGSDKVDQNFLFGWKDGTDDNAGQTGVIQFDFVASTKAGTQQWFRGGHLFDLVPDQNLGVGILLGAGVNQMDRDYSVQANAQ